MDLTQGSEKEKYDRSKKMMLWFGITSLIMGFAGWTSAYIVSSSREDWVSELQLPTEFYISTLIIVCSSLSYMAAKRAVRTDNTRVARLWFYATLVLGIAFIVFQFAGFQQMLGNGYYFTGPTSSIKMSYVFLIAFVHIIHLVAGLLSLSVITYNHYKGKYSSEEYLGISLGETFWHFLGILWLYLILFMTFIK